METPSVSVNQSEEVESIDSQSPNHAHHMHEFEFEDGRAKEQARAQQKLLIRPKIEPNKSKSKIVPPSQEEFKLEEQRQKIEQRISEESDYFDND